MVALLNSKGRKNQCVRKGKPLAHAELVWTDVDSSNVQSIAFEERTHTLCVKFTGGGLYTYSSVDMDVYVDLVHSASVGKYLANVIKARYGYLKHSDYNEMFRYIDTLPTA